MFDKMFDKTVRFIIRTGKAHRRLKPLALTALVLVFCGRALAGCGRQAFEAFRPLRRPAARAAAVALSVCVIFTSMPTAAFAAEETGLCPHHTVHTVRCGYSEAASGAPCSYVCAECGGPDGDSGGPGTVSGNELPTPEEPKPEPIQPEVEESIIITAFDVLDEAVQYQSVPAGTEQDGLNLPATLGASGHTPPFRYGTRPGDGRGSGLGA